MKTHSISNAKVSKNVFKHFLNINKLFLMFFLISGVFVQKVSSQSVCFAMSTPTPQTCPNQVITFTAIENLAANGLPITLTISPNNSGATFVATGTSTLTTTAVSGTQSFTVNTGSGTGFGTVNLVYTSGGAGCSASFDVDNVVVTATTDPVCSPNTGTITAIASSTIPGQTFTYVLNPGGTSNNTGVFAGLVAGPSYTVTATGNLLPCNATSNAVSIIFNPVTQDNTASGTVCVGDKFTYEGIEYLPGTYNIARTDANGCSWKTVLTVTGNPCEEALCTYTQGAYGTEGGKSCADGVLYSTKGLIAKGLASYPLGTMTIGLPGRSIKISNNAIDIQKIIDVLPGGGSSAVLSVANDVLISSLPSSYLKKGVINSTLLAQTITLGLNLGIDSGLGAFGLQAGTLAIATPEGGCGSDIPKTRSCSYDIYTPTINEYKYYTIPAVVGLLPTPTVQGLFDMANKALGGGVLPAGVTLSNLASAVDLINNAFDECRISMGYNQTPLTCIADRAAFDVNPVPIVNTATITYQFSYISDVTIEVWSIGGAKLHSQLDTNTSSCLGKSVLINYPFTTSGSYIIKITTNIGSSSRTVVK